MNKTMKFKNIKGGTEKDAYDKFPWLKKAAFENADIDITNDYLVWEGGVWRDGTWGGGFWRDGTWEGGFWEYGFWRDGLMWDNINQKYQSVVRKDGKFEIKQ